MPGMVDKTRSVGQPGNDCSFIDILPAHKREMEHSVVNAPPSVYSDCKGSYLKHTVCATRACLQTWRKVPGFRHSRDIAVL